MWLIVTTNFQLHNATSGLELRQDVTVECLKMLIEFRVFKLQCEIYRSRQAFVQQLMQYVSAKFTQRLHQEKRKMQMMTATTDHSEQNLIMTDSFC